MGWRIDEFVIRGEIDNRQRDRVAARVWFAGRAEPVELELQGNAWRDLAGRRLEFVNPQPKPGLPESFASRQVGVIGDCTASRKVKVLDSPLTGRGGANADREPLRWRWGNSLYFEWFSETNGRVVLESASYQLTIDPETAWEMRPEEEDAQRRANSDAMAAFIAQLGSPLPPPAEGGKAGETARDDDLWQDEPPLSEAEAERLQEESDRLVDRIMARMDREGPEADYEKILEEELERRRRERGDPPISAEQEAARAEWIEEMNRAAEDAVNDPELKEELARNHPLSVRGYELAVRVLREPHERGWVPAEAGEEHPVADLVASISKAAAKLAGALDGREWPPSVHECGGTIVRLKRARRYFEDAMLAANTCGDDRLVETDWLEPVQAELTVLASETEALIVELRSRLDRNFD